MKNPHDVINKATAVLKAEDSNEENDKSKRLYFMAYELVPESEEKKSFVYENSRFWQYMPNVNFNMMQNELINKSLPEEHVILKKFIEMVMI